MPKPNSFRKQRNLTGKGQPFPTHTLAFSLPGTRSGSCLRPKVHKQIVSGKENIMRVAFFKAENRPHQGVGVLNIFLIKALTLVGNLGHLKHFDVNPSYLHKTL